jgi:DNA sulfur modification protein DndD
MIFKEIRITNLFSYFGEQVFELPEPTQERPLILISGRNGFGKTSFINSVKLLFLGTSADMLRVIKGSGLRPNNYLLGTGREWRGIFNRRTREIGGPDARYGVRIKWREDQGNVAAERYWTLTGNEAQHHLHIETDFDTDFGRIIDDDESAEEFLERRLPKSVVPFFFYDGEQVQQIAEANREGQLRQIERLLDISTIDTLDEYLGRAISKWRQSAQAPEIQADLKQLEGQKQQSEGQLQSLQAKRDELQADIDHEDRTILRLQRKNDSLRAKSLQRDEPRLRKQLADTREQYEALCLNIGNALPQAAPLWAASPLVQRVAAQLAEATHNPNQMLAEQIKEVAQYLPEQLFDRPMHSSPPLTDAQKQHYKHKLRKLFDGLTELPSGGFFSLKASDILDLRGRFDYFRQAERERGHLADDLKTASRLRRTMQDLQAQLDALDNISPEEQEDFKRREGEITEAAQRRDDFMRQMGGVDTESTNLQIQLDKIKTEISRKQTEQVKGEINSRRIARARQAQQLFDDYKKRLKDSRREDIERQINLRFKSLMSSHGQIDRITIDADFALTYLSADGQEVGMANISAGMKQLMAHALQWALKDFTGSLAPVIFDSPLGRLDRSHQHNLLEHFYHRVAHQVILLPTDSELDIEKYRLIQPYVCAEFRLENADGEHTKVITNARMYDVETA